MTTTLGMSVHYSRSNDLSNFTHSTLKRQTFNKISTSTSNDLTLFLKQILVRCWKPVHTQFAVAECIWRPNLFTNFSLKITKKWIFSSATAWKRQVLGCEPDKWMRSRGMHKRMKQIRCIVSLVAGLYEDAKDRECLQMSEFVSQ